MQQISTSLDTKILIETLLAKIQSQEKTNEQLVKRIAVLEAELAIYKNKKNSNNSHTPPSRDENRPMKNQSLREKTDKKVGGQQGHEGKTLECSLAVDTIVEHKSNYCPASGGVVARI